MSVPEGSPVLTHNTDFISGCEMDLLGMGNCPQMRYNVNHTMSWDNSVPMSQCNRLYADGHVCHWCGSKDPSSAVARRHNNCSGVQAQAVCFT